MLLSWDNREITFVFSCIHPFFLSIQVLTRFTAIEEVEPEYISYLASFFSNNSSQVKENWELRKGKKVHSDRWNWRRVLHSGKPAEGRLSLPAAADQRGREEDRAAQHRPDESWSRIATSPVCCVFFPHSSASLNISLSSIFSRSYLSFLLAIFFLYLPPYFSPSMFLFFLYFALFLIFLPLFLVFTFLSISIRLSLSLTLIRVFFLL